MRPIGRVRASRKHSVGLLTRSPLASYDDLDSLVVDPADQLKALADLYARGLISSDDLDRQLGKVLHH